MKKRTKKRLIKILTITGGIVLLCGGIILRNKLKKSEGLCQKIYPDNDDPLKVTSGNVSMINDHGKRIRIVEDLGNGDIDFVNIDIPNGGSNVKFYDKKSGNRSFHLNKGETRDVIISGKYNLVSRLRTGHEKFDASVKVKGY